MSTDNVVYLDNVTALDLPAERILTRAMEANLESAVVVGWEPDGRFYFASTLADGAEVLWLLKLAEKKILEIGDPQ